MQSKHDNGFRAPEVVAEMEREDPTEDGPVMVGFGMSLNHAANAGLEPHTQDYEIHHSRREWMEDMDLPEREGIIEAFVTDEIWNRVSCWVEFDDPALDPETAHAAADNQAL